MFKPMPLVRLSLCPCGFHVLHDDIQLGTVYSVDMDDIRDGFKMRCGGCGDLITISMVMVGKNKKTGGHGGLLPIGIFQATN